jgi:SAM-dependent methyltransferase
MSTVDRYTPGLGNTSVSFMAGRTAQSHAAFVLPYLRPGAALIDVGCGPGTITAGLATAVAPGPVLGIDQGEQQLADARERVERLGLTNARFERGSCYRLGVPDGSVDWVFAHALVEHLSDPVAALEEMRRVLRPGGAVALCSPDWGGFILSPPTAAVDSAVTAYTGLMRDNGGDPLAGRRLAVHLAKAGFTGVRSDARYERYPETRSIAAYLAAQLVDAGRVAEAQALLDWSADPAAMFAQTWVSAIAFNAA